MKIICLGAGLAGLAVSWHLLNLGKSKNVILDIYDHRGIGRSTSSLCSGMLHPFMGRQAKKVQFAQEAINSAISILERINSPNIIISRGILRPAMTLEQVQKFKDSYNAYSNELSWLDGDEAMSKVQGLNIPDASGALWIKNGLTLNTSNYLEALWGECSALGARFHKISYNKIDIDILKEADAVIFACGSETLDFQDFAHLPLEKVPGALLTLKWPDNVNPIPYSLNSSGYLVMVDKDCAYAGSTFEHWQNELTTEQRITLILEKVSLFFPLVKQMEVVECRSAVRAMPRSNLPLLGKCGEKIWFVCGLGAKGLLYHAFAGELLASAVLANDPLTIPDLLLHK